jgi:AraC-like DNA-binding protein
MSSSLAGAQVTIILIHFTLALVILLRNQTESLNPANRFFSLYLVLVALHSLTEYAIFKYNDPEWVAILAINLSPFWYLIGPLVYFYVRNTMFGSNRLHLKDIWHFIPFIIQALHIAPYVISPFAYKLEMAQMVIDQPNTLFTYTWGWIYPSIVNFYGRPISGLLYAVGSLVFLYRKTSLFQNRSTHQRDLFWWFMILLGGLTLLYSLSILLFYELLRSNLDMRIIFAESDYYESVGIIYFISGFVPMFFPHLLYGNIENLKLPSILNGLMNSSKLSDDTTSLQSATSITGDRLQDMESIIDEYQKKFKPYTHPDFNISKMANDLDIPEYQLYYYFRYHKKQKFVDYRTMLRIEHAKDLLSRGAANELTLEAVAKASGYQHRTTFIEHFKKITGRVPSEYLNQAHPSQVSGPSPFPPDNQLKTSTPSASQEIAGS